MLREMKRSLVVFASQRGKRKQTFINIEPNRQHGSKQCLATRLFEQVVAHEVIVYAILFRKLHRQNKNAL